MRHKLHLGCLLLAAVLLLSSCGGKEAPTEASGGMDSQTVGAAASPELTELPPEEMEEIEEFEEPDAVPAVTSGTLVYALNSDWMLLDADPVSGWFTTSWMAKGYGSQYCAVNPSTGQVIEGEEGAEVVLCKDAILQFVWRDKDGNPVSAEEVYYYEGDDPMELTLFVVVYGFDGQVREEREVLTITQSWDDPYYSEVYPAMEALAAEFGGGSIAGMPLMLTASDDNGEAVVCDSSGNELLRLPGADASMTYAFTNRDGSFLSVYRPDTCQTEFYQF